MVAVACVQFVVSPHLACFQLYLWLAASICLPILHATPADASPPLSALLCACRCVQLNQMRRWASVQPWAEVRGHARLAGMLICGRTACLAF